MTKNNDRERSDIVFCRGHCDMHGDMDCSFASLGVGIWTGCDGENLDADCNSVTSPSQQAIRLSFLE